MISADWCELLGARLGQPLDTDTYGYTSAAIWNPLATRLWARTVQLVNRQTARLLGIRQRDWPTSGRVSVAKVAKDQSRGVVHFHAIFRLNGADPPDPAPSGATTDLLCDAIRHAAARTSIDPPECPAVDGIAPVVWGEQIDLRSISTDVTNGNLTDGQVAGYLAKYATKGPAASGTVDRLLAYRDCRHCSTTAWASVF